MSSFLLLCALVASSATSSDSNFILGADASFIPQIEDLGGAYRVDGVPQDPLQIFKDHGMNTIRLKLWHTPDEPYNDLENILEMAERIQNDDLKFILDFHYSDTWADPGKQTKPAAWTGLSYEILKDSVYAYTKRVIQALDAQQTLPDMVQIGNEITAGLLWDDGRVGGNFNTTAQWKNLAGLIQSAIQGIREGSAEGDSIRIMIHIDRGGNNSGARWFFDQLIARDVAFDVIGLSFYPWWHGTLDAVRANVNDLAVRYGKDILIAETAYPWTLQWFDHMNNIVSSSDDLLSGYPASVGGQTDFLRDLIEIVRDAPNQKGLGVLYWAPEYISVDPLGSPWENNALFDFQGNVLSSMDVFLEEPVELTPIRVTLRMNAATLMDTLREEDFVQLRGDVSGNSHGTLPDGKEVTWDSDSEILLENIGGDYWETTFQMYPADSLAYKFWTGFSRTEGTFQRLGWEGPVLPYGRLTGNGRVLVAGEQDTVIQLQYYNSTGESKAQYWRPFEMRDDSIAIYFRVNMGKAASSGGFDPAANGPVAVRGDAALSGGRLDWNISKVFLEREIYSVNSGSFWSEVCAIPKNAVQAGDVLSYQFFIENASGNGWEFSTTNRQFVITPSLIARGDTTLHWDYFGDSSSSRVEDELKNVPTAFSLFPNYPNPFNAQTRITYRLNQSTPVLLSIHDLRGRWVATLVDAPQAAGSYSLVWDAESKGAALPSGIYLIRLQTASGMISQKTLLLK